MRFSDIIMVAATQNGGSAVSTNDLLLSGDAQAGGDTLLLSPVSGSDSLALSGS